MKVIALFTSPDEAAAARLVLELEAAVLEEPDGILLKLIGPGGLPSWAALAMADLLARRAAGTRLATQAYGSMGASDLLVWLMGELRGMAPGAFAMISGIPDPETRDREIGRELLVIESVLGGSLSRSKEIAATRVLERLSEYLPVEDCTGKVLCAGELSELGLLGDALEDVLRWVGDRPEPGQNPVSQDASHADGPGLRG